MNSRKIKIPYKEGTWFALPLRSNGYALGIVARMNGRGIIFGYFFGPKRLSIPPLDEVCKLLAKDAVLLTQFGDIGLVNNEWTIIGNCKNWNSYEWPMPPFVRVDEISGQSWKIFYDEKSLNFIKKEPCDPKKINKFPYDRLSGSGAVEIRLTMILDPDKQGSSE